MNNYKRGLCTIHILEMLKEKCNGGCSNLENIHFENKRIEEKKMFNENIMVMSLKSDFEYPSNVCCFVRNILIERIC